MAHLEEEIADGQMRAVIPAPPQQVAADEIDGLPVLARGEQPTHLRQMLARGGIVVGGIRCARPEGGFVQRELFRRHTAEDHRTQPAIANRQRFQPALGGAPIPQRQR